MPPARWPRLAAEERSHYWWVAPCSILRRYLKGCRICRQPTPIFAPRYSSRPMTLAGPRCTSNCVLWIPRAPPVCTPITPSVFSERLKCIESAVSLCRTCAVNQMSGGVAESYAIKQIALLPNNRKLIHNRIDLRFRRMMEAGFEAEVRGFFSAAISMKTCRRSAQWAIVSCGSTCRDSAA